MINLVVPLPHEGTEMRGKDTAGSRRYHKGLCVADDVAHAVLRLNQYLLTFYKVHYQALVFSMNLYRFLNMVSVDIVEV